MRAAKACSHPTCPNLQPCPEHERKPWEGSTRRFSLPPDWQSRRVQVLRRDPTCTLAITCGGIALSTEVHHLGDRDDHRLHMLAGVCSDCHARESSKQGNAARGARI